MIQSISDLLLYLGGRITREEWRCRKIGRQSNEKWLLDYAKASIREQKKGHG